MEEQKGGSVVTENPKGGITENLGRIQRETTQICLQTEDMERKGGGGGGGRGAKKQKNLGGGGGGRGLFGGVSLEFWENKRGISCN